MRLVKRRRTCQPGRRHSPRRQSLRLLTGVEFANGAARRGPGLRKYAISSARPSSSIFTLARSSVSAMMIGSYCSVMSHPSSRRSYRATPHGAECVSSGARTMSMRTPVEFTMACTPAAQGGSLPADVSTTLVSNRCSERSGCRTLQRHGPSQ